ncbi:hypothetical protein [Natrialba swarupiae]|uniref:Uncharacterized protein n=1 Tax=Natrialba swarupiae TaxID=2448032 RepID=A0A5D5AP23_9EURY|nr:hypothetical protein [Natrialba swarupiae]TYT60871.1 hypothetical protein FYC77_16725 [Natrialba swarupiae]
MPEPTYDDRLEQFRELVEEKTGQEIYPDTGVGDGIGWFMLDISLELNGKAFDADVDFDLSEDEVEPLYAEIYVERESKREETLSKLATRIDLDDNKALYEYYLDEDEVEDIIADLREAHAEVYG